jgi:hypothetical protein
MAALLETKDSSALHLAARTSPGVSETTEAIVLSLHGLHSAVEASCLQAQAGVLQKTRKQQRAASTATSATCFAEAQPALQHSEHMKHTAGQPR